MESHPRVSGFREVLPENNDLSWFSRTHPPQYQPYPEEHDQNYAQEFGPVSPQSQHSTPHDALSHRGSNKSPVPAEITSPGLESVWAGEGDKEVFVPANEASIEPDADHRPSHIERKRRTVCGMGLKVLLILLVALVILAIALGVGLGVGLGKKHKSSASTNATSTSSSQPGSTANSNYNIGGALNPQYFSTKGAFNGSGIALASESFDGTNRGNLVMYFQHHTGQIRFQQLSNGNWQGGDETTIIAADARNSTPLSAVAYVLNGTSSWHVFYVDTNNVLRQKSNSNATNIWVEGPLSAENHTVYNADQVGMQACWYGNDYGDVDYIHTPLPQSGDSSNASVTAYQEVGMHMWYASDDQTFQQLGWRQGDAHWSFQGSWTEKDAHAGVGCYSWGPGTSTYVMMANLQNTVEIWWKDTATNQTNTTTHPINQWTNTSIAINNVQPSTSLGYTNVFYAQDGATNNIMGYNITWAAENTTFSGNPFVVDGEPGLPGTHMSVTALPNESGGNNLYVFYQTEGDDITEFTRDIVSGQWTGSALQIPTS